MKILSCLLFSAMLASGASQALAQSAAPDDAQIAGIVVAANQVDIDAGKLAEKMASGKEVKEFAQMMVSSHTEVNRQAGELVKKIKIKPTESDTSKSLKDGGETNRDKLKKLKGAAFDKAYIDNEVTYHQAVIDTVDKSLMPHAKNAELKNMLVNVRPTLVAHLEQAKKIQSSLK